MSIETERLLQLNQRDVQQQLDEIASFTSSHPHRRAAFFSLLPARLEYMERRNLLTAAATNTMYHDLRPLRTGVTDTLRMFSMDPTLVEAVEAAWGKAFSLSTLHPSPRPPRPADGPRPAPCRWRAGRAR